MYFFIRYGNIMYFRDSTIQSMQYSKTNVNVLPGSPSLDGEEMVTEHFLQFAILNIH